LLLLFLLVDRKSTSSAQDAKGQAAVRDFNAAAALQNSGLYDRALEKWTAYLKAYPADPRLDRVHYYLGICQLHAKRYAEAAATFQEVLAKYPKFDSADGAQYNLGMALFHVATAGKNRTDFQAAATALGAVAAKHPQSKHAAKALYYQGESLVAAGEWKAALEPLKKVADQPSNPLRADALYALGAAQQDLKQHAEAAATFQAFLGDQALARHELAPEVRLRLGISLFEQKKHQDAEPHFAATAGLSGFPQADFAILRQGQCRLEAGKPAEAATVFSTLLQKHPQSPYRTAAQLAAGKCYFLAEKYQEACKVLAPLASAGQNESAEASCWLGRAFLKLSKPQEALAMIEPALQSHKGEFAPHLEMARIDALYDLPARRKETPELYARFLKAHPGHSLAAQAQYMTALAALGQEDYATARAHAEAFLADAKHAQGDLTPAVLYIAAEARLLGANPRNVADDVEKAEQLYRRLTAKYPNHPRAVQAQLRIGWCLFQLKKHDESLRHLLGIAPSLREPAQAAEAQLLIARLHSTSGRHTEAVAACDAALKADPDWSRADEVSLIAAASLRALGQPQQAAQRLEQALKGRTQADTRAQAIYQLGEIAQEQAKPDEAAARFGEVAKQYPKSPVAPAASYRLATICFAKEDFSGALAALNAALAVQDDAELTARAQYLRGLVYQRQKQFDPALKDLQAFLKTRPAAAEAADARYTIVLCRSGLGQFEQAATEAGALVKERPDYPNADKLHYQLGHALLEQKKPAEAAAAFRSLAETAPQSPLAAEGWFHVGRFHEESAGRAEDAAKSAELAKAAEAFARGFDKAKTADLREKLGFKLGEAQFRQQAFDKAAATLLAHLEEHPGSPLAGPARFLAAESLFQQNQFEKALPLFLRVAGDKVEKYTAQSLYRAGGCTGAMKSWADSQKHYEALIAQFPKFEQLADARYGLALALQNQGKLAEARALYEQAAKEEGEVAAKAHFMLGEIAFAEKKYADAVEQYLLVAAGYPYKEWQALARFEAGRCLAEMGNKEKAIESLRIVVDQFPGHPKAKDAARLIEEWKR
jgi:TolA-binding protein